MFRGQLLLLVAAILLQTLNLCHAFVGTQPKAFGITSSTNLEMTKLVYNGKAKDFPAGSPLSRAVAQLGVPVKYSCKKGDCATCQIRIAGQGVKCCIGKVPPEPRLKSLQEKGLEIRV